MSARVASPRVARRVAAVFAPFVLVAALVFAAAQPPLAPAATVVHFQRESYGAFLGQLDRSEVHAVVLHPQGYKAHIVLDDGGHFTVTYAPNEVARLEALAHAKGASFTVASSPPKKAVHHKLRYIAGGILIVVILVVLAVLLVGRRRALSEDEGGAREGGAAPTPPSAGAG